MAVGDDFEGLIAESRDAKEGKKRPEEKS